MSFEESGPQQDFFETPLEKRLKELAPLIESGQINVEDIIAEFTQKPTLQPNENVSDQKVNKED